MGYNISTDTNGSDDIFYRDMTFLHIGDLHLGKRQNGFDRIPDQRDILEKITGICRERRPDALLICGDVYDAALPPRDAVTLLDDFICGVSMLGVKVLMISGNHDSAERLRFGGRLMSRAGVYIAGETDRLPIAFETLGDGYGDVRFVMLPFLRAADIRNMLGDGAPDDPAEAFKALFDTLPPFSSRQVLLSHQFYLPSSGDIFRCDSESPTVGGLDALPVSALDGFCYAALGHIHTPQAVGRDSVRYCGSPLKYSASEAFAEKTVPFVTLGEDGEASVELIPLKPERDVRVISGSFDSLIGAAASTDPGEREHYYYVTLKGGDEPPDAMARLRYWYPNIMQLSVEAAGSPSVFDDADGDSYDGGSTAELFSEFFGMQNGRAPDDSELRLIDEALMSSGEEDRP